MAGITIRGLSKRFGAGDASLAAVADLDLDIKDNQFVTLLGPSGCGKTTTLRLIAGYITPDSGTIEVGGRPLSSPQAVVPPHAWQSAESAGDWTLVGCTVAPGFDFSGFELAPKGWEPGA